MNIGNPGAKQAKEINGRVRHPYAVSSQEALHLLIIEQHIKREWLAHVLRVTPQLLGKYESGKAPLPMDVAARIDDVCRVDVFSKLWDAMTGRTA